MPTFDIAVVALILLSGLFAFMRGFVRSVLNIAAWGAALATALMFEAKAKPIVEPWIPSPDLVDPATYAVLFIVSLIIYLLIAHFVGHAVRSSAAGGFDRVLGLAFGLARGALILVAAYVAAGSVVEIKHWPDPVLTSQSLPFIFTGAKWARRFIPPDYQPSINVPEPPARPAAADGMLSPAPSGHATDAPARR